MSTAPQTVETMPVWSWLSGQVQPVLTGTFSWRDGFGQFEYDKAYLGLAGARPLDPIRLPLTRSTRPVVELKQNGIFGVFRDASPEGYGLQLLETLTDRPLDPLARMEESLGDGVGAIELCEDIQRKCDFRPFELDKLAQVLEDLPEGVAVSRAVREIHGVQGTTLGGERPKMTVLHRGQQWIAKLQDRGDAPNSPLREYLAMKSAAAIGLDVAEVEFHQSGRHQTVVVRRFDRFVQPDFQVQRHHFASAFTLLHLDSTATRGDPQRSYPYLAGELQRWCGSEGVDVKELKRELWRRMAFNAVVGNGDDHPRNHGVLCVDGKWSLSPAYDIAPYFTFGGALAMSITREQHARAARWALLRDCETFGYEEEEANHFIDVAIGKMVETWESERSALGFRPDDAPTPVPGQWLETEPPAELKPRRKRKVRHLA